MTRYAVGKRAKAQCPICGDVVKHNDLVKDWRGTWVCPECRDPKHPQEIPPPQHRVVDAVTLRHPRPLLDDGLTVALPLGVQGGGLIGQFTVEVT